MSLYPCLSDCVLHGFGLCVSCKGAICGPDLVAGVTARRRYGRKAYIEGKELASVIQGVDLLVHITFMPTYYLVIHVVPT